MLNQSMLSIFVVSPLLSDDVFVLMTIVMSGLMTVFT